MKTLILIMIFGLSIPVTAHGATSFRSSPSFRSTSVRVTPRVSAPRVSTPKVNTPSVKTSTPKTTRTTQSVSNSNYSYNPFTSNFVLWYVLFANNKVATTTNWK